MRTSWRRSCIPWGVRWCARIILLESPSFSWIPAKWLICIDPTIGGCLKGYPESSHLKSSFHVVQSSMAIHYEYVMVLLLWGQTHESSLQGPGPRTLLCMASVEFLDLTTGRATNWLCALWIASMHCLQGFPNFPNETARSVNSWNSCLSGSIEQAVSSFFCWPSRTWWTQSAKRWDTGEAFCNTCAPLKAPLGTWRWLTGLTWLTGRYHIWGLLVDEGTYEPVVLGTTPLKDWALWAPSKHSRGMFQFFTVTLGEAKILPVGSPNGGGFPEMGYPNGWLVHGKSQSKMDDWMI